MRNRGEMRGGRDKMKGIGNQGLPEKWPHTKFQSMRQERTQGEIEQNLRKIPKRNRTELKNDPKSTHFH